MVSPANALEQNPIFAAARPESLRQLLAASELRSFRAGEIVLAAGQHADKIFALERGAARVFHVSAQGEEVVLKLFRAPAIFGEAEAFGGISYLEHVSAVTDSEILIMPPAAVLVLLRSEPECAVRMLIDVSTRLAIASYNEKSLAFNPLTVRLANFLLDYATWSAAPGAELRIDLTQDAMAAAIGGTRRSIAKDMMLWQQEGLLARSGRGYVLRDPEGLRRYSDPDRLQLTYCLNRLP